ncbi:CocE/NonD family hydrolase [Streptomyces tirandamycinicus]|uniref:CocE/NonD family hydrolase n=1 Tax=Streptomyces tirandamycinicus TaxID=2174846 RepID=UPI00342F0C9F
MKIRTDYPYETRSDDLRIPVPDAAGGTTALYARVWRPVTDEPVPVLLEYLPFRPGDWTSPPDRGRHPWYAGHGYASARVDVRGHGDSEGVPGDEYTAAVPADGAAVVEWLARQPWCTGRVGMFGVSWGGTCALQIAALAPEPLKAVVAVCCTDDRYDGDVHRIGGAVTAAGTASRAAALLALSARPPDPLYTGDDWRPLWQARLEALEPHHHTWLAHRTRDEYWSNGSVREDYGAIRAAVLAVGGWQDPHRDTVLRLVRELDPARTRGIIGPWPHAYPDQELPPGPWIGFLQETLRWWDHWLRDETPARAGQGGGPERRDAARTPGDTGTSRATGAGTGAATGTGTGAATGTDTDTRAGAGTATRAGAGTDTGAGTATGTGTDTRTGVMAEPLLRFWITDSHPPATAYDELPGRWDGEPVWPSPRVVPVAYALQGPPLIVDSPQHTGLDAGSLTPLGEDSDLPPDQRDEDAKSVSFEFTVAERTEILGRPRVTLRLGPGAPHGQAVARLCDVAPDGSSTLVTRGALDLPPRAGRDRAGDRPGGTAEDVVFELGAAGHAFAPGHRVRLAVSSAYWPWIWPRADSAGFTLDPDGSFLELPVRTAPAGPATPGTIAFEAPQHAGPPGVVTAVTLDPPRPGRLIVRDVAQGEWRLELSHDGGTRVHPDGLEYTARSTESYAIRERDPLSARTRSEWSIRLHRPERAWDTTVETHSDIGCDGEHFLATDELVCRLGREVVFHRTWQKRIPRTAD